MRNLEGLRFNYVAPGTTVYVAAGHIRMNLSRYFGFDYKINLANPSVAEWDNITRTHRSTVAAILNNLLDERLHRLAAAIQRLQTEHNLWKKVAAGLPQQRTADTVSKGEVEAFVQQQIDDLNRLKGIHDALRDGRDSDVASLLVGLPEGLKMEDTPEPTQGAAQQPPAQAYPMDDDDEDIYA